MQKLHDLNDMAAFAKVVQAGGFTAAANTLGLPKSNISRRISRLESTLGVRLLERTTRRLHLTDVGEIYFQHCQRILEEANFAEHSVNQMMETPRGLLRVSASASIGQQLLTPLLAEFLRQHPDIQLQLNLSNRHIDLIEESVDIALQRSPRNDPRLVCRALGISGMHLFASTAYIRQKGTPTQPQQLADHEMLVMDEHNSTSALQLNGPSGTASIAIRPRAVINDFNTIHQLVCDGGGIAVLPEFSCQRDVSQRRLVQVLPEWSADEVTFYVCYPTMRGATPKVTAFVEFITRSGTLSNTM